MVAKATESKPAAKAAPKKETKAKSETKAAPKKTAAATKPKTEAKAAAPKKTAAAKPKAETADKKKKQFVSPHPDGGWQVKLEGSSKATKRFDTKVEAEKYAKELADKQGTSYLRQKKDGKMQKKRY